MCGEQLIESNYIFTFALSPGVSLIQYSALLFCVCVYREDVAADCFSLFCLVFPCQVAIGGYNLNK